MPNQRYLFGLPSCKSLCLLILIIGGGNIVTSHTDRLNNMDITVTRSLDSGRSNGTAEQKSSLHLDFHSFFKKNIFK